MPGCLFGLLLVLVILCMLLAAIVCIGLGSGWHGVQVRGCALSFCMHGACQLSMPALSISACTCSRH